MHMVYIKLLYTHTHTYTVNVLLLHLFLLVTLTKFCIYLCARPCAPVFIPDAQPPIYNGPNHATHSVISTKIMFIRVRLICFTHLRSK